MTRTILLALLFASPAVAVELPDSCRVSNRGGRCVLANVSTLGYVHRIPALAAFAPDRIVQGDEGPSDNRVRDLLKSRGIVWRGHDHGTYERDLLPLANDCGVIVSMRRGTPWPHGGRLWCNHSIILTEWDREGVSFYCPNKPRVIYRESREWFEDGWLGNSMVFGGFR